MSRIFLSVLAGVKLLASSNLYNWATGGYPLHDDTGHLQPDGPWSSPVRFFSKKNNSGKLTTHPLVYLRFVTPKNVILETSLEKNWSLDWLPTTTSNSSWPKINSKEGCPKKTHEFMDILEDDPALPTIWMGCGYLYLLCVVMCPVVLTYNYVVMSQKFTELKDLLFQLRGGTNILRHESLLPAFSRSFFLCKPSIFSMSGASVQGWLSIMSWLSVVVPNCLGRFWDYA